MLACGNLVWMPTFPVTARCYNSNPCHLVEIPQQLIVRHLSGGRLSLRAGVRQTRLSNVGTSSLSPYFSRPLMPQLYDFSGMFPLCNLIFDCRGFCIIRIARHFQLQKNNYSDVKWAHLSSLWISKMWHPSLSIQVWNNLEIFKPV